MWLLLHYYLTLAKVGQVNNMPKSQCPLYCRGGEHRAPIAVAASVELLIDGN